MKKFCQRSCIHNNGFSIFHAGSVALSEQQFFYEVECSGALLTECCPPPLSKSVLADARGQTVADEEFYMTTVILYCTLA